MRCGSFATVTPCLSHRVIVCSTSVRKKLDDPRYADWFVKFKGFGGTSYPGGAGKASNGTFHVPTCDWYGTAARPAKCSGFYHDEKQTPEKALSVGGGSAKDCE